MSGFLLDTNCISELVRIKPDSNVTTWIEEAEESLLYLSVLTLGEIRKGLASLPQGKRRSQLETWLEVELHARFSGRILPIDIAVRSMGIAHRERQDKRQANIYDRCFAGSNSYSA